MSLTPFATQADLELLCGPAELVQLTDDAGAGVADAGRVADALAKASRTVISYITPKYDLAAGLGADALALLGDLTCAIARYSLYRELPPEKVKDDRAAAMAQLRDIQSGKATLDTGHHEVTARPEGVLVSAPTKLFGRDKMGGF